MKEIHKVKTKQIGSDDKFTRFIYSWYYFFGVGGGTLDDRPFDKDYERKVEFCYESTVNTSPSSTESQE